MMGSIRRAAVMLALGLLAWAGLGGTCRAEIVFLSSGRTLSVKSHRAEGDVVVLSLRGGGEITCSATLVDRIEPDEVPHPDPTDAAPGIPALPVPYAQIIEEAAAREGVDARLVRAVIRVESAYRPQARSRKGAMGLMQLMPDTARRYAVRDPYDPGANVQAGIRHLKSLLDRFGATSGATEGLSLALAAYNAGEAAVERFRGVPPYPETQNYVRQVLRLLGAQ